MIWFTADQHFGHSKILEYCSRPFKTVEEMNETIIANHNTLVGKADIVYHLGDFAFRNHQKYLEQLNGQHFLIKGNHDRKDCYDAKFLWVQDVHMLKYNGINIFMSHYSHRIWPQCHYGVLHLYAHSHGNLAGIGKSMDIGVDTNDFFPYSLNEIMEKLN